MRAFVSQVRLGLILAIRNRMALVYGFIFPLIFLIAYWALYRHDEVPIALHLGELLTVTVLGGACFGLPTTLVSERERGVWRRYRLTPAPAWLFIASVLTTRYILILAGALLQFALALALGMPWPAHPLGLLAAFSLTAAAFMGLGLIIAALADNVPAVQALGQCLFLPMLIIGGVAVRLTTLPDWALHLSAFFPGRYAVAALQSTATGGGLPKVGFDLVAISLIGASALVAALRLFRWDAGARRWTKADGLWLVPALGAWVIVGILAESQGRVSAIESVLEHVGQSRDFIRYSPPPASVQGRSAPPPAVVPAPATAPELAKPEPSPVLESPVAAQSGRPAVTDWRSTDSQAFKRVAFDKLPPDGGVVAPFATGTEEPDPAAIDRLKRLYEGLAVWPPGQAGDPVQRVRNYLYVAAVPDLLQMSDVERFTPRLVLDRLQTDMPIQDLQRLLYWIAMHPEEGDQAALRQMERLGLPNASDQAPALRGRVMLYAFKCLGRLTGDIPVD